MTRVLDRLIAQLEDYSQSARQQIERAPDQAPYWRGVLFGVELALLEARKPAIESAPPGLDLPALSRIIFDTLENLIALSQARLRRELLVYNARATRYELLKAVRLQAGAELPTEYEVRANEALSSEDT